MAFLEAWEYKGSKTAWEDGKSKEASDDGESKTASEDGGSKMAREDSGSKTEESIPEWLYEVRLFNAVKSSNISYFESLLPDELSTALSIRDMEGRSLLYAAAEWNQAVWYFARSSEVLLNSQNERGWAPIHITTILGHLDLVNELIILGANINLTDFRGLTPLHYAAQRGQLAVAEVLVSHGANINSKDKALSTPLHQAAGKGKLELCEFLLKKGAEIDAVDQAGQTPLTHAVICDHKEVVLFLIRHGADMAEKEEYVVLDRYPSDFLDETSDLRKDWESKIRKPNTKKPRSNGIRLSGVGMRVKQVCGKCCDARRTTDDRTLQNAKVALSWYNEKVKGRDFELVKVVGGTMLEMPFIYHCNFIARPKNGSESQNRLFFAEVKSPDGNLVCTVCCIIGSTGAKSGLNKCRICEPFPDLIQHPRGKKRFTKWRPMFSYGM